MFPFLANQEISEKFYGGVYEDSCDLPVRFFAEEVCGFDYLAFFFAKLRIVWVTIVLS